MCVADFVAYALLLLALLGYACLPSKPSNGAEIAERLAPVSMSAVLSADLNRKFRTPKQEQEYRTRSESFDAAAAALGDDDPQPGLTGASGLASLDANLSGARVVAVVAGRELARVQPAARGPPRTV